MTNESFQRLANLIAAGNNPVYMTSAEATELVQAGFIRGDQNQPGPVPGSVRVTVTDAGNQYYQSAMNQPQNAPVAAAPPQMAPPQAAPQATPQTSEKAKPVISEIETGVAIPSITRTSNLVPRESIYPFDSLGEPSFGPNGEPLFPSFHVAATEDNPEPHKAMASTVSAAKKRSEVEVTDEAGNVVMENVTRKKLIKGEDGKPVKGEDGKRQYQEYQATQPKTQITKNFIARRVNASDPKGPGVRVFRVPLDYKS